MEERKIFLETHETECREVATLNFSMRNLRELNESQHENEQLRADWFADNLLLIFSLLRGRVAVEQCIITLEMFDTNESTIRLGSANSASSSKAKATGAQRLS
jgi:hypothetical protein